MTNEDFLIKAVVENNLKTIKALVTSGTDINAYNSLALRFAAKNGYFDIVKFLVENGADVNIENKEALRWAIKYGHIKIVDYLKSIV
jgi:ankyrin repeat protein